MNYRLIVRVQPEVSPGHLHGEPADVPHLQPPGLLAPGGTSRACSVTCACADHGGLGGGGGGQVLPQQPLPGGQVGGLEGP